MRRKERAKLADLLERDQGARIRRTNAGFLAMNPVTKKTVSWHTSPTSDTVRGERNLKTDLKNAGFAWPFAGH